MNLNKISHMGEVERLYLQGKHASNKYLLIEKTLEGDKLSKTELETSTHAKD